MNLHESNAEVVPSVSLPDWGGSYQVGYCPKCSWRFLSAGEHFPETCPHCFQSGMEEFDLAEIASIDEFIRPPELYLPFSIQSGNLQQKLGQFTRGLLFAPVDLSIDNLLKRMQWILLPVWLIDSQVRANWKAEVGFNYQVKSHQEKYADHQGWQTKEVLETRQRWEPRQGTLDRGYQNVTAQALDAYQVWENRLGKYDYANALPYTAPAVFEPAPGQRAVVCLPNRSQQDAWPDTLPAFQMLAADECRQACGADHIRGFHWKPEFHSKNWSLLLLPVLSTFYLDDDGKPQQVLMHGQTNQLSGARRASMRRAQAVSLTILMAALILFAFSLCLGLFSTLNPTLLPLAGIGGVVALLVALGAIYPVVAVWMINRKL